jgi:hypothetical protein
MNDYRTRKEGRESTTTGAALPPREKISSQELFDSIVSTAELYTDFPAALTEDEKQRAIELAKKHTARVVVEAYRRYLQQKPGKAFRFFTEDTPNKVFDEIRAEKVQVETPDFICPLCRQPVNRSVGECLYCFLPLEHFENDKAIVAHLAKHQDKLRAMVDVSLEYDSKLREAGLYRTDEEMRQERFKVLEDARRRYPWNRHSLNAGNENVERQAV